MYLNITIWCNGFSSTQFFIFYVSFDSLIKVRRHNLQVVLYRVLNLCDCMFIFTVWLYLDLITDLVETYRIIIFIHSDTTSFFSEILCLSRELVFPSRGLTSSSFRLFFNFVVNFVFIYLFIYLCQNVNSTLKKVLLESTPIFVKFILVSSRVLSTPLISTRLVCCMEEPPITPSSSVRVRYTYEKRNILF